MTREDKPKPVVNPSTPKILAHLSRDRHSNVRWRVAENTSTPPEILTELARDSISGVRYCVAINPSTPLEALLIMMVDDDEYVRKAAERSLSRRVLEP